MGRYLGTMSTFVSVVVRDSTSQGVIPRSSEAWEGRNSVNNCLNGANEKFIDIYAKSRCHWSGHAIVLEPGPQRYGHLKL